MYATEINRGVSFLDGEFGRKNWLPKINGGGLNLADPKTCMIGQLYGDFHKVVSGMAFIEAVFTSGTTKRSATWAEKRGFLLKGKDSLMRVKYAMLTAEWRSKVKELRAEEGEPEKPEEEAPEQPKDVLSPVEVHVFPMQGVMPREMVRTLKN